MPTHRRTVRRSLELLRLPLLLLSIFALIFLTLIHTQPTTHAAPSNTLNFQARLLNSSGSIVPDGNYSITFNLYENSAGGSSLWNETHASLSVKAGYLSVYLGSNTPFPALDWSDDKFLTMNVNGDGEMSPRLKLTAVPYALSANHANTASSLSTTQGSYTGTLSFDTLTDNQSITLPDDTGEICLSTGNCTGSGGSGSYGDILQGGNSFSGQDMVIGTNNAQSLQLETNNVTRLTINTSGQLNLANYNCSTFNNGGTLTTDSSGNVICANDDGGVGGGQAVTSLNGLQDDLILQGTSGEIIVTDDDGDTITLALHADVSLLGNTIGLAELENNSVNSDKIVNGSIQAIDLESTNAAGGGTDNYVLTYDHATGGFTYVSQESVAGSAGVTSLNSLSGSLTLSANGPITVTDNGSSTITVGLNDTAVTPDTYGTASSTGSFTVDQKGRITSASSISIAIDASQVTSGTLSASRGGTGSGFTAFTGPTGSTKTFTLPNSSATILTTNTAVTVGQGGTGATTLTLNGILYGNGTGTVQATTAAANSILTTNASNVPSLTQTLPTAVQGNITSLGTITSGVWNGTALTDTYVSDTLTIGSSSSVHWTALNNYPTACSAGQAVTAVGDTLTCASFAAGSGSGNYIQNTTSNQDSANFNIRSVGTTNVTAKFRVNTSQTADIIQVRNSTDTATVFSVNPSGAVTATSFSGDGANLTDLNATNLTTGTVPSARISGSYTGITGVGTITAGTWNGTSISDAYVDNNITVNWTGLQNYPTACSAGQAVTAVGDTLTCATFATTDTNTTYSANNGITLSGTTFGLTGQALALHNLNTNGIMVRTGSGTVAARSIEAGTGLSVTNGDGISGNPSIGFDYSATLAGNPGLTANQVIFGSTGLIFEGSTANNFETLLTVANPTADRTITLPNASGTVAVSASGNIALSASGDISFTGTLPVGNGGTGQTTAQSAINSLSGLTTNGDLLYHNGTNVTRLARGSNGQCLTSNSTTLVWGTCGDGDTTYDGTDFIINGTSLQTGNFNIQSAAAGSVGAIVRGHASQTAHIFVAETAAGEGLWVTDSGDVEISQTLLVDHNADFNGLLSAYGGSFFQETSGTSPVIISRQAGSATNDLFQAQNNAGTALFTISSTGTITAGTWNGTSISDAYVDNNITVNWTGLQNYPTACSAGQAVTAVGDTLTCATFATTDTNTTYSANNGITLSGTTFGLTGQALALHNLNTNGIMVRTGSGTVAARSIEAGTGLSVTNGDGISGNPSIGFDYSATLAGNPGLTANQVIFGSTGLIFEGSTANNFETLLTVANPTADRTITLPNASGTVAVSASGNIALSASGDISFTGTLPVGNGGTGQTTAQSAINSLSGLTTNGDLLYHNGTNVTRLARGSNGQCLTSNSTTLVWGVCGADATDYIANGTTLQTSANFNIQSAAVGSVTGTIRKVTNQTADLFNIVDTNGTTKLFTINASGNVGIGTDTVGAKLHVVGSGNTNSTLAQLIENSDGIDLFTIYDNGQIDIGVPGGQLNITNNILTHGSSIFENDGASAFVVQDTSEVRSLTVDTTNRRVGIGTGINPTHTLHVGGDARIDGSISANGNIDTGGGDVIEKMTSFTPTAPGWYRIVSGNHSVGGRLVIMGDYNNKYTNIELTMDQNGYGQAVFSRTAVLSQTRHSVLNGGLISQARISSNGSGTAYLDIYISDTTSASTIAVLAYGPNIGQGDLVSSPVVGATAGSDDVRVLTLGPGFRSTQRMVVDLNTINAGTGETEWAGIALNQTRADTKIANILFQQQGTNTWSIGVDSGITNDSNFCIYDELASGGTGCRLTLHDNGNVYMGNEFFYDEVAGGLLAIGASTGPQARLHVGTGGGGVIGQIIQGVAGQSADLLQVKNSGGTVLASVTSDGIMKVGTTGSPTLSGAKLLVTSAEVTTTLRIGNGTNGVEFSSSGAPIYSGSARPTKRIMLTAEYIGAVLDAGSGSNNEGTMTSGVNVSDRMNYYKWTTSEATNQSYDVVVQVPIPTDFDGWTTTSPINISTYTSNTTNGTITFELRDSTNTVRRNFVSVTPNANNTWQVRDPGTFTGTYTPGDYMTFRIRMQSPQNGDVRIGNIYMDYYSKF